MHAVLVNMLRGVAEKIDEDPEKFLKNIKTFNRRFKKKIQSKKFQRELDRIASRARRELMQIAAKKLRSYR